jgi:hypothetical protein
MSDTTASPEEILLRLESLVARLEDAGLMPRQGEGPSQTIAVDLDGNPGTVVPGELIESAWGNATVDRVLKAFQTKELVQANWAGAHDGAMGFAANSKNYFTKFGAVWSRMASPSAYGTPMVGAFPIYGGVPEVSGIITGLYFGGMTTDGNGTFVVPISVGLSGHSMTVFCTQHDFPHHFSFVQLDPGGIRWKCRNLADGSIVANAFIGFAFISVELTIPV